MVAHERLTEPRITMEGLLAKPRSFSNFPAFLDLDGRIKQNIRERRNWFNRCMQNCSTLVFENFLVTGE